MHINEAYEHRPIHPYAEDASCGPCVPNKPCKDGCIKNETQCVNVSQTVVLTPMAGVGPVTVVCSGDPTVTCCTNAGGTACTVTLTQKVCATIPVNFGVELASEEPTIDCAPGEGECCRC